jgi:hypothetical protein
MPSFQIQCSGLVFRVVAETAEEALFLLKRAANNRRATNTHERWPAGEGQYQIEVGINPDVESLTLADVNPDHDLVESVRVAGCHRCGGKLVDGEHGLKCERCGATPCACEGCEGHHCRRCGSHTWGDCYQCDGCDIWDDQYVEHDSKEAARILATEEMDACIKTGLGTDHISEKYGLEE